MIRYKSFILLIIFAHSILFLSCDDFPKDTRDSFQKARSEALLVGVTENPPYVVLEGDSISGTEVDIIKKFAREKDLRVKFTEGSETDLVKKLQKVQLHVVIGGFENKTAWKKKAALTTKYDQKHVFLIPKGENSLMWELDGFINENLKK